MSDPAKSSSKSAAASIEAQVAPELRRAGRLLVASGLIWPVQAGFVAWAMAGWAVGDLSRTLPAVLALVLGALLRGALDHRAGGVLFAAGDKVLANARREVLGAELSARGAAPSAAIAALVAEKLPLLLPWITRFRPAMMRVRVLPLVHIVLAGAIAWPAALILLISGPLIPVFMALIGMAAEQASRKHLAEIGTMNAALIERLDALIDLRLLGATRAAEKGFTARAEGLRARTMAVLRVAFLSSTVLELFAAIGVAMMAVYVGFSLLGVLNFGGWGDALTIWQGVFLLLIVPDFYQPLRDLASAWHDRAAGLAVAAEMAALAEAPRAPMLGKGAAVAGLRGPISLSLRGAVTQSPRVALPDLELPAGGSVAVSGPSGAGKTTLIRAVAGLCPLQSGEIRVMGHVLDTANADAWRARLAVMTQGIFLPDSTLGEWLGPGDPTEALRLAHAQHIVARLPAGLDTRLGASGGGVSGGETRRLSLARAIHSGRDLILADEPTADLDPETAAQIIATLRALQSRGTALLIATHDPALIAALDQEVRL